jgi:uncharacterized RDD family membrane protein YckC
MKCPKCGYLGFEEVERCRNCGYEFSLAASDQLPELTLRRRTDAIRPLEDIALGSTVPRSGAGRSEPAPEIEPAVIGSRAAVSIREAEELPLFAGPVDDTPLITRPSPPRPPLAVRRATPEVPRIRVDQPRLQPFDLEIDDRSGERAPDAGGGARSGVVGQWPRSRAEQPEPASLAARLAAVVIDLLVLAAIDAIVVYLTMQICGVTPAEIGILPKGPLLAFLFVQNGGFLTAFTAGGQTLGKMAAGIRVVGADTGAPLDLGRAGTRTIAWIFLAVPAGLGFLTLFSREHRGLHDRLAGTRVVRVAA